jgi:hypothetical protein
VKAVVRDTRTNLGKRNVRLYVDGRGVSTLSYSSSTDRLQYTPRRDLSYGRHTVRVVATDAAGNVGRGQWTFRVVR